MKNNEKNQKNAEKNENGHKNLGESETCLLYTSRCV